MYNTLIRVRYHDNFDGETSAMVMSACQLPPSMYPNVPPVILEEEKKQGVGFPSGDGTRMAKKMMGSEEGHLMGLSVAATMVPRAPMKKDDSVGMEAWVNPRGFEAGINGGGAGGEGFPSSEEEMHAAMSIATIRNVNPSPIPPPAASPTDATMTGVAPSAVMYPILPYGTAPPNPYMFPAGIVANNGVYPPTNQF